MNGIIQLRNLAAFYSTVCKNKSATEFEHPFPGIMRCMENQHYVNNTPMKKLPSVLQIWFMFKKRKVFKWQNGSTTGSTTSKGLRIDSEKI